MCKSEELKTTFEERLEKLEKAVFPVKNEDPAVLEELTQARIRELEAKSRRLQETVIAHELTIQSLEVARQQLVVDRDFHKEKHKEFAARVAGLRNTYNEQTEVLNSLNQRNIKLAEENAALKEEGPLTAERPYPYVDLLRRFRNQKAVIVELQKKLNNVEKVLQS